MKEKESIFYHIYPLGFCGSPRFNNFSAETVFSLDKIYEWIPYFNELGINALYLGPLFESVEHGYDTVDYFKVDKRLGSNESLKKIIEKLHENNILVILDGVFHHVGREFFAFKDLKEKGINSSYKNWFVNVDFNKKSPNNDNFYYEGWNGHYSLVKLNLSNNDVKAHLFDAVKMWIEYFKIDGLRLDAADYIALDFLRDLSVFSKKIKADFYLLGEVIHGDYRKWVNEKTLDSVTNYECYKGLWSSFNDKNFFEIAYSLKRQFGDNGIYKNLTLYNFCDNHDVDRIASTLKNKNNIFPLYCLLFTMPGIPSIYYGSEFGIEGKKTGGNDAPMRPKLELSDELYSNEIFKTIKKIIKIRKERKSIMYGNYKELYIAHEQFAFLREFENEKLIVIINSSDKKTDIEIKLNISINGSAKDILNNDEKIEIKNNILKTELHPNWARFLLIENFI